jgi:TolB protein
MKRNAYLILAAFSAFTCADFGAESPPIRFDGRIAFGAVSGEGNGFVWSDIVLMDGAGNIRKISSAANCYSRRPDLTRDGTKLAFTSCAQQSNKVFIFNTDGTGVRNITNDNVIEEFPTWSPDGRFLAFISLRDGYRDIFLLNDATGGTEKVTQSDGSYWIGSWSADNASLIYYGYKVGMSSQSDVYSFELQSRISRPLTSGTGVKMQPRITSDATLIAYQRNWKLHFLTADGVVDTPVANAPDSVHDQMQWSSRGEFLIFMAFANGRWDIYRVNRDGSGALNLTRDSFEGYTPVLSPDDREIAYVANTGSVAKVFIMNNDGSSKRALTKLNQREFSPTWGK